MFTEQDSSEGKGNDTEGYAMGYTHCEDSQTEVSMPCVPVCHRQRSWSVLFVPRDVFVILSGAKNEWR